jgi:hypothetical protein
VFNGASSTLVLITKPLFFQLEEDSMRRSLFALPVVSGLLLCASASAQIVFPTTPHASHNLIPFGRGATVMHQVLDDELWVANLRGQPVAHITKIAFSPGITGTFNFGVVEVNLGYTDLEPLFLDLPSSGNNPSGPMTSFFSDPDYSVNVTASGTGQWSELIFTGSFDYDSSLGNLLIEIIVQGDIDNPLIVSRTEGSAEGSRTFESDFGDSVLNDTATRMQFTFTGGNRIVPDEFMVARGIQIAGDLSDVQESDDSYLKFNPGITLNSTEPPVWIVFDGTLPTDSPASLEVTLEAQANTSGLTQTIEMFDYISGQYDQVDAQAATNNDSIATVDLTADISDYVESGTGAVKTRVGWRATGPVALYPLTICIDQVVWTVTQ